MLGKIFAGIATTLLFVIIGIIIYKESTHQVHVSVQLKSGQDPFMVIKRIVPVDSSIIEVKETNKLQNRYLITVSTHRKKHGLIEIMRNNNRVENAEDYPD